MSLRREPLGAIPDDTAKVARGAFRKGNLYVKISEELGTVYEFTEFVDLFPSVGQPAEHPVRLVLVTILQFVEGLSDRDAADAVRSRIDWKYLLRLGLEDEGFDHSVLSEFRSRLLKHGAGQRLLDSLIEKLKGIGLIKVKGKQRTDSTHVLAAIRVLNRLELVHETMRSALESLATVVPEWLEKESSPEWYKRYGRRLFSFNVPKTDKGRQDLAQTIGADGFRLLSGIDGAKGMQWLREIPAVERLRKVWEQQYTQPPEPPRFLEHDEQEPSASRIASPHDDQARYSIKKGAEWTGYKVHLTETCDEGLPRIIVNVESTPATTPDWNMLPVIHQSLKRKEMLPGDHLVDTGYVSISTLLSSKENYDVRVVGPPLDDSSWQAREGGFDKSYFEIDWEAKTAKCPAGNVSKRWTERKDGTTEVSFGPYDCYRCKFREVCVRGTTSAGYPKARHLSLRRRDEHEALQTARGYLKDEKTKELYMKRAGIEGTISQGVRQSDLRRARYAGLEKVSLQHIFTALALNFTKLGEWFLGTPLAKTRKSKLVALAAA